MWPEGAGLRGQSKEGIREARAGSVETKPLTTQGCIEGGEKAELGEKGAQLLSPLG